MALQKSIGLNPNYLQNAILSLMKKKINIRLLLVKEKVKFRHIYLQYLVCIISSFIYWYFVRYFSLYDFIFYVYFWIINIICIRSFFLQNNLFLIIFLIFIRYFLIKLLTGYWQVICWKVIDILPENILYQHLKKKLHQNYSSWKLFDDKLSIQYSFTQSYWMQWSVSNDFNLQKYLKATIYTRGWIMLCCNVWIIFYSVEFNIICRVL